MDRLNYFNPFYSKNSEHEDQLTRAYLVLLKHSFHSFSAFLSYVSKVNSNQEKIDLVDFLEDGWSFETQKENPSIETRVLGSILISDNSLSFNQQIHASNRNARYDGIITMGRELTLIIENKPNSDSVWFNQLTPSQQNLSEDIVVMINPICIEWKTIISHLNLVKSLDTINGFERIMIEDFLSYIDQSFPKLNPFDNFSLCKGNFNLLQRRIVNILKDIAKEESLVKYHKGWGYYIDCSVFGSIKKIGLILRQENRRWFIELCLFFGDTQSQAKEFYSTKPDFTKLGNNWDKYCNFHLAFATSNLVWFRTESQHIDTYIDFWAKNIKLISQHSKDNIPGLLDKLVQENVIVNSSDKQEELRKRFYDTAMSKLNVCPGFGIIKRLSADSCIEKDQKSQLVSYLAKAIAEGLSVVGLDSKKIIKHF